MPYEKDYGKLAQKTAVAIEAAVAGLHMPQIQDHLKFQIDYVNRFYNWDKQSMAWTRFLKGALDARSK
jgi:hypothetical protein